MPPVLRFSVRQVAIGFAAAAIFVALLLWHGVAGLRGLAMGSSDGLLALFLSFVFTGAQAGVAVFPMAEHDEPPPGRRRRGLPTVLAPSRVPAVHR